MWRGTGEPIEAAGVLGGSMANGHLGKRARRRQRGKQQSELRLQTARQACQAFPAYIAPPLTDRRGGASPGGGPGGGPGGSPGGGPGAGARTASKPAVILVSRAFVPAPAASQLPTHRPPVSGRVRVALDGPSTAPGRRPLAPLAAPTSRTATDRAPNAPPRGVVDIAAIARRRQASRDAAQRRAIAVWMLAPLALVALVATDPFGRRPSGPSQTALTPVPDAGHLPRIAHGPVLPRAVEPSAPGPMVPGAPSAVVEPAPKVAALPPLGPLADPPDSHITGTPARIARLQLPFPPEDAGRRITLPAPRPLPAPPFDGTPTDQAEPEQRHAALPSLPLVRPPPAYPGAPARPGQVPPPGLAEPDSPFDARLVQAARQLTSIPGGYDPKYMRLAYPMGDVPEGWGVCSDVVVRAYRGVGIDLQHLVHVARLGSGDTNVDHRRVTVLMRFFAKFGQSLPVSPYPESYKPGDVVAYDVPWGRTSKWHIAIVTDQLSPSLRPMVVHNRGYGAKLEDALFHKRIIGHYRLDASGLVALRPKPLEPKPLELKPLDLKPLELTTGPAQAATAAEPKAPSRLLVRVSDPRN